jgi:5-methylcytosine-specific restriction endonuclease McrA
MTLPRSAKRGAYRRHRQGWSKCVTFTPEWASWRTSVFRRDGYRCVRCPRTAASLLAFRAARRHLEPHHILRKIDHPELMYEVDNGVTLCDYCHAEVTGNEQKFEAQFQSYVRKLRAREEALSDMSGLEEASL